MTQIFSMGKDENGFYFIHTNGTTFRPQNAHDLEDIARASSFKKIRVARLIQDEPKDSVPCELIFNDGSYSSIPRSVGVSHPRGGFARYLSTGKA